MYKKAPCKDCPKRSLDPPCHDICPEFLEYKGHNKQIKDRRRHEKHLESMHFDMIMRNVKRTRDGR